MTIFCIHGVAENATRSEFQFRNIDKISAFREHLSSRANKYVSLSDAIKGLGDALTIDDSTHSAYVAAKIARQFGHQVTLFVNGLHIQDARPYSFVILNLFLDAINVPEIFFDGQLIATNVRDEKKNARKKMKRRMQTLNNEEEQMQLLYSTADKNGLEIPPIPAHLQPLRKLEIVELIQMGVSISNHGWSHLHPSSLTQEELAEDILRGSQWLDKEFGIECDSYAVPFGDALPLSNELPGHCRIWLTVNDVLTAGQVGPRVFNRVSLKLHS
jgi:peptidoglycan/xylan/chitin deacetylase (PgdA/CDA1 family)